MMFVYCFVVVLYLVDRYYSESNCINGSFGEEEDPLDFRAHFEFAFELSWTVSCLDVIFTFWDACMEWNICWCGKHYFYCGVLKYLQPFFT